MVSAASVTGPKLYLAPFRRWPSHHPRAMRYAKGRVLDVGAGAGRVSLHLQDRGQDVVAIDNSPRAIAVCRRRGVREARVLAFDAVDESLGTSTRSFSSVTTLVCSAPQQKRNNCSAGCTG
jgi:2-polyprenyl-3-methyl-5-hydroxy-6-metoxy-1,4-benzoquinol methylase